MPKAAKVLEYDYWLYAIVFLIFECGAESLLMLLLGGPPRVLGGTWANQGLNYWLEVLTIGGTWANPRYQLELLSCLTCDLLIFLCVCAISFSNTEWIDDHHPIFVISKKKDGWMGGRMDGVTGGITRQVQYFFDNARGFSLLKNLARGRRLRIFPVVHQIHPKENVWQLLYTKKADIWCT